MGFSDCQLHISTSDRDAGTIPNYFKIIIYYCAVSDNTSFERNYQEFEDAGELHAAVRTTDPVDFSIFYPTGNPSFLLQRETDADLSEFATYTREQFSPGREMKVSTENHNTVSVPASELERRPDSIETGILVVDYDDIRTASLTEPGEGIEIFGWSKSQDNSDYRLGDNETYNLSYHLDEWKPATVKGLHYDEQSLSEDEFHNLLMTGAQELRTLLENKGYEANF